MSHLSAAKKAGMVVTAQRIRLASFLDRKESQIRRVGERLGWPQRWLQEFAEYIGDPRLTLEDFWVRYVLLRQQEAPKMKAIKGEADALAYGRGLNAAHGALGRAVNSGTAPDALIAMDDAGLGPYLSRRRNLDMLGLNDRHIARLPGRFSYKVDVPYVLGRSPDLIVLISSVAEPTRGEHLPLPAHAALAADSTFHARYEFVRVYTMRPDYHLGVFRRRDSRAVPADF